MATPKDVNIHDEILDHALRLLRYANGVEAEAVKDIAKLRNEAVKLLEKESISNLSEKEVRQLLRETEELTKDTYSEIAAMMEKETAAVVPVTAAATRKALEKGFEGIVNVKIPGKNILSSLATNAMIQGSPQKAYWSKQEEDLKFRFQGTVRRGILNNQANGPIIRAVRDDFGLSQKHASALVQTSIQTVANDARLKTFESNNDLIKALVWVTALDGRVCLVCIPREGLKWKLDGTPIGHRISFQRMPIHFNDRCVYTVETKTFKELGFDIPEVKPSGRASDLGVISADTNFQKFLERKGKKFQDEVLGKGRAELWREGKITLIDLIKNNGQPLTLKQIKAKIS